MSKKSKGVQKLQEKIVFFSLKHHHKQDKIVFLHVFGRISNDFAVVYIFFAQVRIKYTKTMQTITSFGHDEKCQFVDFHKTLSFFLYSMFLQSDSL